MAEGFLSLRRHRNKRTMYHIHLSFWRCFVTCFGGFTILFRWFGSFALDVSMVTVVFFSWLMVIYFMVRHILSPWIYAVS